MTGTGTETPDWNLGLQLEYLDQITVLKKRRQNEAKSIPGLEVVAVSIPRLEVEEP